MRVGLREKRTAREGIGLWEISFFLAQELLPPKLKKKNSSPERLDELRALNRKTFEETGEYMTEEEIRAFRQPRWTDRREFQDDD